MIRTYRNAQPDINLTSVWACSQMIAADGSRYWYVSSKPTEGSQTVNFVVDLPAAARIYQTYVTMTFASYPLSGAEYTRMNGEAIPSDGKLDVTGIKPTTTAFQAAFTMRAYGKAIESAGQHSGVMTIADPTLVIVYDDGESSETPDAPDIPATRHTGSSRLPRLLDRNLREVARIECKLSIDLKLDPLSTAKMDIPPGQPTVQVGDFVELFSPDGSVGIFRAVEVATTYKRSGRQLVWLEHGLCTLSDDLAIGGNAVNGSVRTVIETLLAGQSVQYWILGDCDIAEDYEMVYEYQYESKLQAITRQTKEIPDGYLWEFDQSVFPWVMHLRQKDETEACECRLSRNLSSVEIHIDRSTLCTRVYPFGAGEDDERITLENLTGAMYLDADTTSVWGYVSRRITADDVYDALTLRDVANRYLDRYKNPLTSVKLDAHDLFSATGEPLDRFSMGRICRVALPDFDVLLRERVIGLSWRDVFGSPEAVTVTLSNRMRDASDEIAELMREATNSKMLGGKVSTEKTTVNNDSVTQSSSLVHYFDITGYGNTLAVIAEYKASSGHCRMNVDGVADVPDDEAKEGSVNILKYLKADANGVALVGEHFVQYFAAGTGTISVSSTVSIKSVGKGKTDG